MAWVHKHPSYRRKPVSRFGYFTSGQIPSGMPVFTGMTKEDV
jgi:hypothetical protein